MESLDLLYYVLAFCALFLTVFVCFVIWQIVSVIHKINAVIQSIHLKVTKFEDVINGWKNRWSKGVGEE